MTDHPLTDEICDAMIEDDSINELWFHTVEDSMRVAYDKGREDRLKQVIEWLRSADSRDYLWVWIDGDAEINKDELIADLRKAMRLQQQENN